MAAAYMLEQMAGRFPANVQAFRVLRAAADADSAALRTTGITWQAFATDLGTSVALQDAMSRAIASSPFRAVFFETRPVRGAAAADTEFQFVLVDSPALASVQAADADTFAEQMRAADDTAAVTFPNLGGDAVLCAPGRAAHATLADSCAHAAPFFRAAAANPAHSHLSRALWRHVSAAVQDAWQRDPGKPLWLSTSGLGVYYLHFRVDSAPKYYTYAPFRAMP